MPYQSDVNVAMGLVSKHYLEQTVGSTNPDKDAALSATESAFSVCNSVKSDLTQAFQFWDGLVSGIRAIKDTVEIANMFLEADEWLQSRRL